MKLLSIYIACFILFAQGFAQNGLDPSFGNSGTTYIDIDDLDNVSDVLVDTNGLAYVLGYTGSYDNGALDYNYFVARVDVQGNVDSSFGNNGVLVGDYPGFNFSTVAEGAIVDDGILICGNGSFYGSVDSQHVFVAKIDFSGNIDSTFGQNGYFKAGILGPINDVACLKVVSGNIMIGGMTFDTAYYHQESAFVIQLLPAGELDSTFGGTGMITWSSQSGITANMVGSWLDRHADGTKIVDIQLTPWGDYMACGYYDTGGIFRLFSLCFDQNGNPSATYGVSGAMIFDINPTVHQFAVKVDSIGDKMLIGAVFQNEGEVVLQTVDKFSALGTPQIFGLHASQESEISDLTLFDGNIFLSAYSKEGSNTAPGYDSDYLSIYQMNKDFAPVSAFGNNGLFQSDLKQNTEEGVDAIYVNDDFILMAGYINDSLETDVFISRLSMDEFNSASNGIGVMESISAYPNPAVDYLTIDAATLTESYSVEIYNAEGKVVRNLNGVSGESYRIDIHDLPTGIYYARCSASNSYQTIRFVKQ